MTKSQKTISNFYEFQGLDKLIYSHFGYEGATKEDVYGAVMDDLEDTLKHAATPEMKNYVRFTIEQEYKG